MSPEAAVIIPLAVLAFAALIIAGHKARSIVSLESERPWDRDAAVKDCTEWAQQNDATPEEGESED